MVLYIYKITNLLNGKVYVGKHTCDTIENSYMGSGVAIKRAIKKYGLENFKKEIVCICLNENEQNEKEIFWIEKFGTFDNGYNLTKGGEGSLGRIKSKEEIEKARIARKHYYMENPDKRKALSDIAKQRIGSKNPFYGKKLSQDHIDKMTKARIAAIAGAKNPSAVTIKCIETGDIFYTAKDAAEFCGLKHSTTVLKAAKGQIKKAGGYTWQIIE